MIKLGQLAPGYKILIMLNPAEHEHLNANKYKIFRNSVFFQAQISLECYFSCSYKVAF